MISPSDILEVAERLGAGLRKVSAVEWAGPCPVCVGRDRFAINIKRGLFNCRGCGVGGDAIDLARHVLGLDYPAALTFVGGESMAPNRPSPTPIREPSSATKTEDNYGRALWLWRQRKPIVEGSSPWRYLREARDYGGPFPATLGYLPASAKYPPSMIAAFGLASEPEPGILTIADDDVRGVHLTSLAPDGREKAGTDADKKTVGTGSMGAPIVLAPCNDLLGLAIVEGIEDGLSVFVATGLGVWAAGTAGRMSALADAVPFYVDAISIFGHRDIAGVAGASELAAKLKTRGFEVALKFLEAEAAA